MQERIKIEVLQGAGIVETETEVVEILFMLLIMDLRMMHSELTSSGN